MIIQAIPGSGKTYLARKYPDTFTDTDALLEPIIGKVSKESYENLLLDEEKIASFKSRIFDEIEEGRILLTNTYLDDDLGIVVDHRFTYSPETYVQHLESNGRIDLLKNFDQGDLAQWAQDYYKKENVEEIPLGSFLSHALCSMSESLCYE